MNIDDRGIWNKDFTLVWQGHFTSAIGSVVYSIAIGFFVLEKTGSTAMMGTIMALSQVPRLFLSPFAGVVIDRFNKKWILIVGDFISGCSVLVIAVLFILNSISVSALAVVAVVLGIVQTFFLPTIQAGIPSLVSKDKITQANAAYSLIGSGSQIIGRFAGGYIYGILGPLFSFLLNGLSFLFSAVSEFFISSNVLRPSERNTNNSNNSILQDMRQGISLLHKVPGLIPIFSIVAFLNFFGFMVITLYIPLFQRENGLGVKLYGVVMAASTIGLFLGNITLSKIDIPKPKRFFFFAISGLLSNIMIVFFPYQNDWIALIILIFLSGILSSPINIILNSSLQMSISSEYQGRIFSLIGMIGGVLVPLAIISAGVVAETTDIRFLISANAAVLAFVFLFVSFSTNARKFINNE